MNREIFDTVQEAKVLAARYMWEHNTIVQIQWRRFEPDPWFEAIFAYAGAVQFNLMVLVILVSHLAGVDLLLVPDFVWLMIGGAICAIVFWGVGGEKGARRLVKMHSNDPPEIESWRRKYFYIYLTATVILSFAVPIGSGLLAGK